MSFHGTTSFHERESPLGGGLGAGLRGYKWNRRRERLAIVVVPLSFLDVYRLESPHMCLILLLKLDT